MDILKRKRVGMAFLGIKTDRYTLNHTDIIYRALLIKIGKGNTACLLIDFNRCDRGRYFLYQSQSVF